MNILGINCVNLVSTTVTIKPTAVESAN